MCHPHILCCGSNIRLLEFTLFIWLLICHSFSQWCFSVNGVTGHLIDHRAPDLFLTPLSSSRWVTAEENHAYTHTHTHTHTQTYFFVCLLWFVLASKIKPISVSVLIYSTITSTIFLCLFKKIVHPKMNWYFTHPQAIQDVDEFVHQNRFG